MRYIAIVARFIPDQSLKKIIEIYNDRFNNYKVLMEADTLDYQQSNCLLLMLLFDNHIKMTIY